jgi:hypothetical protein
MNTESRAIITLGADTGGRDAGIATSDHILKLRKLLKQECKGPYSDIVKEVALVLRIDGSVQSWKKVGVDNVMLQKKRGYVTADIFVPVEAWGPNSALPFPEFLAREVQDAIVKIGIRLKQREVSFAFDELSADVSVAVEKFLA